MNLFRNKYKTRIEDKIIELEMQIAYYKTEEFKISILKLEEKVHFICLAAELRKQVDLLKTLL